MALPTLGVLDKDSAPQTISTLRSARAAAADSAGVVLSTEDKAVLDSLATKLDTCITALQIIDNMVLAAGTAAIGKLAANADVNIGEVSIKSTQLSSLGSTTAALSVSVTPPTDRQNTTIKTLVLTPHSADSVLASGVLAATQQWDGFFNKADGGAVIQTITLIDQADQGAALTIYFFKANQSLGTEDSLPDIDDTEALDIVGWVDVATTDYKDLGANKVANLRNVGLAVIAAAGTDDLYVGVVNGAGTPTYAASSLHLIVGALQD